MNCPRKNIFSELDDIRKKVPDLGKTNAQFEGLKLRALTTIENLKIKNNLKDGDKYLSNPEIANFIQKEFAQEAKSILDSEGRGAYVDYYINKVYPKKSGYAPTISEDGFEGQLRNGSMMTFLKQSVGGWDNLKSSILTENFWNSKGIVDPDEVKYLTSIAEKQAGRYTALEIPTEGVSWFNRFFSSTKKMAKQFFVGGKAYTLGVGIFNPVGAAMLLTGQLMGRMADIGYSSLTFGDHNLISALRDEFGILTTPGVSSKAFGAKSLPEILEFISSPKKILQTAKDFGIDVLNSGFQEIGDLLLRNNDVNRAVDSAIMEYGIYKNTDDFAQYLRGIKETNPDSYRNILGDVIARAKEKYELTTGMKFDGYEGQFANSNWFKDLYFFYGKRGTRTTLNALNQMKDIVMSRGRSGIITKYHDILIQEGPENAGKFLLQTTQYNEDILQFINRIFVGISMGARITRNDKDKEEDSVRTRLSDAVRIGSNFTNILQSWQSSPVTRELAQFLTGIINHDGGPGGKLADGMLRTLDQFFKDVGKRMIALRSITGAGIATITNDADFFATLYKNYLDGTSGYLKFFEDSVSKQGVEFGVPKSNRGIMETIFPYLAKEREVLSELRADQRFEKIVKDPGQYFMNWLSFSLPFIKEANIGTFNTNQDTLGRLVSVLGEDKRYGEFLKGNLNLYDNEIGLNAYNILTTHANQKAYKSESWKDNLIKNMGEYNDDQLKENLFVALAQRQLGNKYNDFKLLADKSNPKGKMGLQLLMFAEADSPGSSRELLASYAQELYQIQSQKALRAGGVKEWYKGQSLMEQLNPGYAENLKTSIAKELAPLLFVVDRPSYNDISLAHVKKQYPEFEGLFAGSKQSFNYALNLKNDIDTLYALDTFAKQEAYLGKPNAMQISNAFAAVLTKGYNESQSEQGDAVRIKGVTKIIDEIKDSEYPKGVKDEVVAGILYGSKVYLDAGQNDKQFAEKNSKELNELYHRLFGTLKDYAAKGEYYKEKYGLTTAELQDKFGDIAEAKMRDADFETATISKLSGINLTDKNEFDGYTYGTKYSNAKSYAKSYGTYSRLSNFAKNYPDLLRTTFMYPPQNYDYRGRYSDNEYGFLKGVGYFREQLGSVYTKNIGDFNEKGDAYEKPAGRSSSIKRSKGAAIKLVDSSKYAYSRSKVNEEKNKRTKARVRTRRS